MVDTVPGLVSYDAYLQWRDSEAGAFCSCDCVIVCDCARPVALI